MNRAQLQVVIPISILTERRNIILTLLPPLYQPTPPLLADCLVRETSVTRYGISKSARPLKRVSKATICSSRLLRKEGSLGFGGKMARQRERAEEVEDALEWAPRQRARSV